MQTFYYFLNEYVICGICGWVCAYEPLQPAQAKEGEPLTIPLNRLAYCTNGTGDCSQFMLRFVIKPNSVEGTALEEFEEETRKKASLKEKEEEENTETEKEEEV